MRDRERLERGIERWGVERRGRFWAERGGGEAIEGLDRWKEGERKKRSERGGEG